MCIRDRDFFAALKPSLEGRLGMLVSQLGLSQRAENSLDAQGIATVRDLVSRSRDEVAGMWNLGDATLQEIEAKLKELELELGMQLPVGAGA